MGTAAAEAHPKEYAEIDSWATRRGRHVRRLGACKVCKQFGGALAQGAACACAYVEPWMGVM